MRCGGRRGRTGGGCSVGRGRHLARRAGAAGSAARVPVHRRRGCRTWCGPPLRPLPLNSHAASLPLVLTNTSTAREKTAQPRVDGGLRGAGAREGRDAQATGRISARLLVPKGQIGCLLGRGGQIIESMRRETGASIQILPSESLPLCAEVRDRPPCLRTCALDPHPPSAILSVEAAEGTRGTGGR